MIILSLSVSRPWAETRRMEWKKRRRKKSWGGEWGAGVTTTAKNTAGVLYMGVHTHGRAKLYWDTYVEFPQPLQMNKGWVLNDCCGWLSLIIWFCNMMWCAHLAASPIHFVECYYVLAPCIVAFFLTHL